MSVDDVLAGLGRAPPARCPDHGHQLVLLSRDPAGDPRCTSCGHRYDPDGGPVLQTRELPARMWPAELVNRHRARRRRA